MSGFTFTIAPDAEDADAAEVLVDGAIAGRPYRFLLDTGAARSRVEYDDYTSSFAAVGSNHAAGVFGEHSEEMITVPEIALGSLAKRDFTLVRGSPQAEHARNLIGMDFLKDYRCHFRFDTHQVTVDGSADMGRGLAPHVLLLGARFHPYVDVRFDSLNANTVWDTGAGITVVDLGFIRAHPTLFQYTGGSQGSDSTGAHMEAPTFLMAASLIGGYQFPPHKVAGVDLSHVNTTIDVPMDMILGFTTLSKANWVFDFPNRRWAISQLLEHSTSH